MKKIFILFVILTISIAGFSQAGLGFKGGVNFSKLTDKPYYSNKYNNIEPQYVPGFTFGIVGDIAATDIFFVQMEILYAELNSRYELPGQLSGVESNQNTQGGTLLKEFNTLQIPLVAKFVTYDKKVDIIFEGGFFWGYILDGKYSLTGGDNGVDESGEISFDEFQREDFGFVVGLGFGTDLGKRASWSFNLRYNRGVTDLYTDPGVDGSGYVPRQTRSFTATLTLMVL